MSLTYRDILLYCSVFAPLVPILIGVKKRPLLCYYALTGLFFDIISLVLRKNGFNIIYLGNLFFITEFAVISFYYRDKILLFHKVFIPYLLLALIVFSLATGYRFFSYLNLYAAATFSVIYMIYVIGGLFTVLREKKVLFLGKTEFFWANVAFLIYAAGNFMVFLFKEYFITSNRELFVLLWVSLFLPLNIIKNLILGVAVSKSK